MEMESEIRYLATYKTFFSTISFILLNRISSHEL